MNDLYGDWRVGGRLRRHSRAACAFVSVAREIIVA